MKNVLENGKYFVILISGVLLLSSFLLVIYGFFTITITIIYIFKNISSLDPTYTITQFLTLLDINLIALFLYLFSVGIYELFIEKLNISSWLKVKTVEELKSKLASTLILILVITFAKNLEKWKTPLETLYFGIAISLITAVLVFYIKIKDENGNK